MKKWLLVTGDFPPGFVGGVASWTSDLALALHESGQVVTVLARQSPDTAADDHLLPYPVVRMWSRSWNDGQAWWAWWFARRRIDADTTVVCSTWPLAVRLLPLVKKKGARIAVAFHGSDLTRLAEAPPALGALAREADSLFFVSDFLRRELEERLRLTPKASAVLPWPLQAPPAPVQRPEHGLLTIARLTPLKGVDRAIALARALEEPLRIVGSGPAEEDLRVGVPQSVAHFVGPAPRSRLGDWFGKARATVLLPRPDRDGTGAEGFGLVLLESAAHGVPVVGCSTGGVPEAVGPGLVLHDPDAPDLDQVRALLRDDTAGLRAREWVTAQHNPTRCLTVLRETLGKP